ncbi:MAG: alcohol dehydrogenase catalytic domain-containing protein [Gammaproteobacteria bacterium]|nr:alcohol dehydrogenase catalytic domain-containing protein [Gammaproteobacteria bacterium]
MKAVRLVKVHEPLEMQELPIPEIGPNDVLVKVKAAGICHSDVHYRDGVSPVRPLPMTLGHEVAGVIEEIGIEVGDFMPGDRVCLHYIVSCGSCEYCSRGSEQFCTSGSMIGKYRDGGYAEYIKIPARSIFRLPDEIPFEQGAIMMCSSATAFHALKKARFSAGETVAVFGTGGLGMSAVQLALSLGALKVFAVDINPEKLKLAEQYGAVPINARENNPVDQIRELTSGRGVDVVLELIGLPETMRQAIDAVAIFGRVAMVGLNAESIEIDPYNELLMREAEIVGVADHLAQELTALIELVRLGKLDLSQVISHTIPLDAGKINEVFDEIDRYSHAGRVVIVP